MAVVKADAYGHGAIETVAALNNLGKLKPEYYGVALVEEAIELRNAGYKEPILCFAPFDKDDIALYLKYKIEPTLCTAQHFKYLRSYSGAKLKVQVNVDTGMGRLGVDFKSAYENVIKLVSNKNIVLTGVYTHFATSDDRDKKFAILQLDRFKNVVNKLKDANIYTCLFHAANSGAILDLPETYFDMVRVGISLYGYYPSLETSESIPLKPVMSIVSKVSTIKELAKGDTVSYGRLFTAKSRIKSATVAIGYADGLYRNLTNSVKTIIRKKFFDQIGRVTMDRIMINIKREDIKVGDKVILLGKWGDKKITAWDWSKVLNTIPYEITCNIGKRVPRKFIS